MKKLFFVLIASLTLICFLDINAHADSISLYPSQDAEIMTSGGTNTTVSNINYGTSPYLTVSAGTPYGPAFSASTSGLFPRSGNSFGLLQFDFSSIPAGSIIDSAVLSLYSTTWAGNSSTWPSLFLLTGSWSESLVTYSSKPSQGAVVIPYSSSNNGYGPFVFNNMTSVVQSWLDAPSTNFGLITTDTHASAQSGRYYCRIYSEEADGTANDPRLDITYTPPAVPEPASMYLLGLGLVWVAGARRKFKK